MLLLHLGAGKDAWLVKEAMQKAIAILPSQLVKDHNLGPRSRDGPPSGVHLRGRRPGLLLRSSQPLAAGIQRERPRTGSPVHAERNPPVGPQPRGLGRVRLEPQQPSPQGPRIHETIGEARRANGDDRLKPPGMWLRNWQIQDDLVRPGEIVIRRLGLNRAPSRTN